MLVICIILAVICAFLVVVLLKNLSSSASLKADSAVSENRLAELRNSHEQQIKQLTDSYTSQLSQQKDAYEKQIVELKASHAERLADEREAIGQRFQSLAAEILKSNSEQLDKNSRQSIETVIGPMRTQLEEFSKGFRECYSVESRDRLTMREEIKRLYELSMQVGAETSRLTHALKGNTRIQGQWGEFVLSNILEHSGLESGEWFVTQDSTTLEDGSIVKPDAVIHCPGNRDIIIDSKASLKAYFQFLESDDDTEREQLMKAHVRSIENHIKTLRDKDYQNKVGAKKGDFVFMFMPHEGAFLAAMRAKPDLWQNAFDSHVVLASPTHLITTLQLVEQMWKAEKQSVNAQEIALQGNKLIDSIQAFLSDLNSVGENIKKVQKSYDSAVHRLSSGNNNVLRVAGRLAELGVKPKKPLPPSVSLSDSPE